MNRLKNEDSLTNYEVQFIKSDGLPLWVSLNVKAVRNDAGDILYIDGIMEDISERKQVEQALIESEEKYRILAETAQDIIIVHDLSGTILYINQAGLKCLGYSPDQIIGNSVIDFIVPENREDMSERQKRRMEGDTDLSLFNIEIVDSSNNHIPIEISSSIFKEENKPAMCLMYGRDLSARKKLEDQLHQSQKMDSIGTLAGGIAHDFNNLLTIINGLSEIALKKIEKDDPLFRDLRSIHAAGKKAEDLTRKLLGFSRKQIIHPKIIDINVLISDLDKMLRRLIREDIRIEKKLFPQVLHIKADPGQIEQILINLVVNARDAISERSYDPKKMISVRTQPIQIKESDLINYPDSRPGFYILISVSDTGIGMDRLTIDRVFEPFFTTKEKGHGTGLGMATVYGIVKQNDGFITINSAPGEGSTINIYWPSVDKEFATDDPFAESLPEDEGLGGNECILVVEDDKDVLYFTSFALRNLGYTVIESNSGREALLIIKNIKMSKTATEDIDLVIADLIMPGMNGKELADKIAEISDSIKVIFTSAYTEEYITDNEIIAQEDNFLPKPFTINMLAQKVRETIDFE
jgi:PAS domain S-box-containing protein